MKGKSKAIIVIVIIAVVAGFAVFAKQAGLFGGGKETVEIDFMGDEWSQDSTPAILAVTNKKDGKTVYHAVDKPEKVEMDVPKGGEYKVRVLSPIEEDGSIYSTSSENENDGSKIEVKMEKVPAEKVNIDEFKKLVEDITKAIDEGDDSLKGDKGKKVKKKIKKVQTQLKEEKAFNEVLNTANYKEYAFVDLTGDGTKSLILGDPGDFAEDFGVREISVYYFDEKDGTVKEATYPSSGKLQYGVAGAGGFRGSVRLAKDGGLSVSNLSAGTGDYTDYLYTLKDGKLVETILREGNLGEDQRNGVKKESNEETTEIPWNQVG